MKKFLMLAMLLALVVLTGCNRNDSGTTQNNPPARDGGNTNSITVTVDFVIPPLDLRGYDLCHFEASAWFLEAINIRREAYGLHPYGIYESAAVTAIEHSLDMRDNNFGGNVSSDGRTHQQRHNRWMGVNRTRVTSSHTSSHRVSDGPLTRECVDEIVERFLSNETTFSFIMNPTYHYVGIGFSIQANGRGRLNIVMTSREGERAAHRARTPEEREEHRQRELERIRQERGFING